ncbi:DUF3524 domain-containing protein [Desulfurivibrio sp. D14AmB]|uniref:tRNA-queuosine alpha-mannosyltransferase domain-containing protein n=1 Tax=Desulfurivibrio sp. D14AmB TaxID=3374370 RepID=UPI00376EB578
MSSDSALPLILVLEPYFGGSHRRFLTGLQGALARDCRFELLTLPARGWKWRMRLAAPLLAEVIARRVAAGELAKPARILCSSLLDLAALKALLPATWQGVPLTAYFHENQFAYPVRVEDYRDLHFALTNYTTALAADRLAFNSAYNLATFLAGCREVLAKAPDMPLLDSVERIARQSVVLPPGLDLAAIDAVGPTHRPPGPPVILWNHRWEHDKQPELFGAAIRRLAADNFPFRLIIAGQEFVRGGEVFARIRQDLPEHLLHCGFVADRIAYYRLLGQADLVVSTAAHEFFGLAVLEAVRAGCRPLLPARLAYPELFPAPYLYADDEELLPALKAACRAGRLAREQAVALTAPYDWPTLAPRYRQWLLA